MYGANVWPYFRECTGYIYSHIFVVAEGRGFCFDSEVWVSSCCVSWLCDLHTGAVVQFVRFLILISRVIMARPSTVFRNGYARILIKNGVRNHLVLNHQLTSAPVTLFARVSWLGKCE